MKLRSILLSLLAVLGGLAGTARGQDVRITEFLAINATDITDEDGTNQPWIEIWNPDVTSKVDLSYWTLSNGTTSWTFPHVEIMPDEHMYFWASGKNRSAETAALHTSFTLPPGGGTLTLQRPDGTTASQFADYPAQRTDVSYGRDEWDSATIPTQVGFYSKTTPGDRNNYSGSGVSGAVKISVASKAFTAPFQVTLTQSKPNAAAVIRYTTDGTVPTVDSPVYSTPLEVAATEVVRARVYQTGLLPGETQTSGYLLLDDTTAGFSSTMPLIVVSNFNGGEPPADGDQPAFMWVWEPAAPDNLARFTNAPTLAVRTAIDRRGSSTLNNPKYNVNVECRDAQDDDDNAVSLLEMADGSDWVFTGPLYVDVSEIHNPFIFNLSRQIGRYAPDTRLAEVFFSVNGGALNFTGSNSGDYFGIYNIIEKIRQDANRVNITKLAKYDNGPVTKTGGYIYKVDRLDAGDTGFVAGGQTMAYYYPKEVEIKSPQRAPQDQYLTEEINDFNTALQSDTWNDPVTGYAAYLDVAAAIDHHLLNIWAFNVDALRLSGYWTKERGGKLTPGPIWDFDLALDSTEGRDSNPAVWRSQISDQGTDYFNYIWWNRLFLDIDFYQKYIDRWQDLRRGLFAPSNVNALLDTLNGEMSQDAIDRDAARWGIDRRPWVSPFDGTEYPAGQAAEVQRIKDWLQQRANFFDSQWVGPVTASLASGNVTPGTSVALSGPDGATIYYTLDGSDPRPSGGAAAGEGVLTYTGTPIAINSTTRLRARAYNASWLSNPAVLIGANNPPLRSAWSGLTDVRYSTDTPASAANLVVSELHYHPADPTSAELNVNPVWTDSDFEFLELHNIGSTPVDLGGMQFTKGITFTFSGNNAVSVPPNGYVVVASNPTAFAVRYPNAGPVVGPYTGQLDNSGEEVKLKAADGSTVFDLTYDDGWYPSTDGDGYSLVAVDEHAVSAAFSTDANWRPSTFPGGSPGAADPADIVVGPFTPVSIATGTGGTAALPDYTGQIRATGGGSLASLSQTPAPGTPVPVGTVHITLAAVDGIGAGGSESFDVSVTDGTPPVFGDSYSPPSLITGADGTAEVADYTMAAAISDNVGVTSVTQDPPAGTVVGAGVQPVTLTAADAAGNSASAIFNVAVADSTVPTIAKPAAGFYPLFLSTPDDSSTVPLPDYTAQAATYDNLAVTEVTQSPLPDTNVSVGLQTVTLTAHDAAGNTASCSFTVTVEDGSVFTKTDAVPGESGWVFKSFGSPAIDDSGAVAYVGKWAGAYGSGSGIFTGISASLLVKTGDDVPGLPGLTFKSFRDPVMNSSGKVAFTAVIGGAGVKPANDVVLVTNALGDGSLTVAARKGGPAGQPDQSVIASFQGISLQGNELLAVVSLKGGKPAVKPANEVAAFQIGDDLQVTPVVRYGQGYTAVGSPATTIKAFRLLNVVAGSPGQDRAHTPGNTAFFALLGNKGQALLDFTGGQLTSLASSNEPTGSTPFPTATFHSFGPVAMDSAAIAFRAVLTPAVGGISKADDQAIFLKTSSPNFEPVAVLGQLAPGAGGALFRSFGEPVVGAGTGGVAFPAKLSGPVAQRASIWWMPAGGELRLVARAGEGAAGLTGAKWHSFPSLALSGGANGGPIFYGQLAIGPGKVNAGNNFGVWAADSTGTLRLIVRKGDLVGGRKLQSITILRAVPGSSGVTRSFNNSGQIIYRAGYAGGRESIETVSIP